jgi:uncharacterized membrane protein YfcA
MTLEVIVSTVIIVVAFFGEAVFGFGGGLISIPLMTLLIGVKDAVSLILLFQFCMCLLLFKSYKQINWQVAKPMTLAVALGTVIGTFWLSHASPTFLEEFLIFTILLFLIKSLWFNDLTFKNTKGALTASVAGLGGGIFSGAIGTGDPILAMYLTESVRKKLQIRATFICLFFIIGLVRLAVAIPEHLYSKHVLQLALFAALPFLIAIYCGQRIHTKVNDEYYRVGINILLAVSAITLIFKVLS